jgi:hypothetical protein
MTRLIRPRQQHVHHLVEETAIKMAAELYDALMQNNTWYAGWKRMNPGKNPRALEATFIAQNKGRLVSQARATLAHMLTLPIEAAQKDTIAEVLILDATLKRGRGRPLDGG